MICKFGRFLLLLAFGFNLLSPLHAAEIQTAPNTSSNSVSTNAASRPPLKPGPDSGKIAFVTAYMLEKLEYLQHPFDTTISARLFDAYLSSLDPQHLHFLQSDLDEFSAYRTNLNRMTIKRTAVADTRPAYEIFYRYLDRLHQHVDYVDQLLKTEKFEFTTDDRVLLNRKDSPYPKDLDEAKKIWRDRLRYEYLMEKVSRETQKTNATESAAAKADKGAPAKSMHDEIVETLGKSYHRTLRVFQDWDSNDVLNDYLEWLARSYDPHSDYQGPMEYEDFAMQMNLSLFGIGAELRSEDGYCKIEVLLNGPAKLSKKIKVGDRIVAVAQSNQPPVDIFEMPLNKAVRLIRGPKGTEVRLTVIPSGAPDSSRQVVTLVRDEIKLENGEAKGKIFEVPGSNGETTRLGVIDLPSFYATIDANGNPTPKSTTADVSHLLKKFKEEKVAGVILDLRRNGGGSLEEAIRLAGLFIKEGPVVQIKRSNGEIDIREDTDPSVEYDGPLILLTSRFSASASEIVAGALQDYGRALIVGDVSTFGKGTAQQLFPLSKINALSDLQRDPGTLKLTNSKFYRASGASTELRGVAADIVLPSVWNDSTEIGENTLDNHLPWDTIDSSHYEKVNMVQPSLAELAKRSATRIETNKEFAYVQEDITRIQKQREDKTVSLNEKQQLADRAKIVDAHKTRDQERATRKIPDPKVYDLTVAQASMPGLPPLTKYTNGVSTVESDMDGYMPPVAASDRDELSEAITSETEHAENARLQEAKNILTDYISLLKNGTKQNTPMLAK
jgi:carboxyl-terminal processing protease